MNIHGKPPSAEMKTHLKRDLIQGVWDVMLDDRFMHAYVHGLPILCSDGIWRRVFPRLITYSADYPEKYEALTTLYTIKLIQHPIGYFSLGSKTLGSAHVHVVW